MVTRYSLLAGPAATTGGTLCWLCDEPQSATTLVNTGSATGGDLAIADGPVIGLPHPWGSGVLFTGSTTQYAYGASSVSLSTTAVTVTALVIANAFPSNNNFAYAVHKLKGAANAGAGSAVSIFTTTAANKTGLIRADVTTVNGTVTLSTAAPLQLRPELAHLLAMTYDGSNVKLYLDGREVASAVQTGAITWGTGNWVLGVNNEPASTVSPWDGWIGDVRVYQSALSQADIVAIYQSDIWRWAKST